MRARSRFLTKARRRLVGRVRFLQRGTHASFRDRRPGTCRPEAGRAASARGGSDQPAWRSGTSRLRGVARLRGARSRLCHTRQSSLRSRPHAVAARPLRTTAPNPKSLPLLRRCIADVHEAKLPRKSGRLRRAVDQRNARTFNRARDAHGGGDEDASRSLGTPASASPNFVRSRSTALMATALRSVAGRLPTDTDDGCGSSLTQAPQPVACARTNAAHAKVVSAGLFPRRDISRHLRQRAQCTVP